MSVSPFTNPAGRAPEQAAAYVRSILELLGDRDPVEVQARLLAELRPALADLSDAELRRPEAPGKWSIAQVVRHLADTEVVFAWRLRMVLAEDRPPITGFDQDAWTARFAGPDVDVAAALRVLEALREDNLRLLRSAAPEDWERVGMHAERGPESVRLMAKLYAGHDLVHLNQIARIRAALGR